MDHTIKEIPPVKTPDSTAELPKGLGPFPGRPGQLDQGTWNGVVHASVWSADFVGREVNWRQGQVVDRIRKTWDHAEAMNKKQNDRRKKDKTKLLSAVSSLQTQTEDLIKREVERQLAGLPKPQEVEELNGKILALEEQATANAQQIVQLRAELETAQQKIRELENPNN